MAVQRSHINFLELSGVFLSLQWFLTFLRDHHGIYQPLVVPMLPAVAHTSMQTVRLELRSSSLSLSQSDACSGEFECRGRPALQGHTVVQVMVPASSDCRTDMGLSESVRVKGKRAMHEFLFSTQCGCSRQA